MNNITFSFLVTTVAGLSTMLGTIPIFFKFKNTDNIINGSISFAAGVMASVSIFSLLPESMELLSKKHTILGSIILIIIFALIGILLASFIDKVFKKIDNKLYKLGIINSIALMIHNIPEGISISIPIYYSTGNRFKAFLYTFISGISELLGALITYIFLYKYINFSFISSILAMTFGIMIYISLFELFPTSLKYKNKKISLIFFALGFIFMIFFK